MSRLMRGSAAISSASRLGGKVDDLCAVLEKARDLSQVNFSPTVEANVVFEAAEFWRLREMEVGERVKEDSISKSSAAG